MQAKLIFLLLFVNHNLWADEIILVENPQDPWESVNRKIHNFNEVLDSGTLKPVAKVYQENTNETVQLGVRNFFNNLDDIFVILNDILQFKPVQALQDLARFSVNCTIGLFGVIDVASVIGLPKHNEDFGQTLAVWGLNSGPYIVLPFLGPSSMRDLTGRIGVYSISNTQITSDHYSKGVAYIVDPIKNIKPADSQTMLRIFEFVKDRSELLEGEKTLDSISLDRYASIRDIYLQYREFLATDGKVDANVEDRRSVEYDGNIENESSVDEMLEDDDDL